MYNNYYIYIIYYYSFLNIDFASAIPLSCSRKITFIDTLIFTTLFPIAMTLLLGILCLFEYNWGKKKNICTKRY